jgi:hypothetical protein
MVHQGVGIVPMVAGTMPMLWASDVAGYRVLARRKSSDAGGPSVMNLFLD